MKFTFHCFNNKYNISIGLLFTSSFNVIMCTAHRCRCVYVFACVFLCKVTTANDKNGNAVNSRSGSNSSWMQITCSRAMCHTPYIIYWWRFHFWSYRSESSVTNVSTSTSTSINLPFSFRFVSVIIWNPISNYPFTFLIQFNRVVIYSQMTNVMHSNLNAWLLLGYILLFYNCLWHVIEMCTETKRKSLTKNKSNANDGTM